MKKAKKYEARMDNIKIVSAWLKDLSGVLGVEFKFNEEGICTFQAGDDILAIEVSGDFPIVYIYSSLLELPLEDKELAISLLARALELNSMQIATRGGSIALVPGGGLLIYCYSMPIEGADSEKFSSVLGAFFETLPGLKKQLTEFPSSIFKRPEILPSKFPFQKI